MSLLTRGHREGRCLIAFAVVVARGYQGDAAVVARAAVVSIRCPVGTLSGPGSSAVKPGRSYVTEMATHGRVWSLDVAEVDGTRSLSLAADGQRDGVVTLSIRVVSIGPRVVDVGFVGRRR